MPETLNYDLNINHLDNGHTKLTTPLYWAIYDEKGEIINAGVNGHTEFPIPLPVRISITGRPKRKVGKDGIKSILRGDRLDNEKMAFQLVETEGNMSEDHQELFERLRAVLNEYAPEEGHYFLNLKFAPFDDDEPVKTNPDKAVDELLKEGFRKVEPKDRSYFLDMGFYPFEKEGDKKSGNRIESELIEPSDQELAAMLAFLNHFTQH